VSMRCGRIAADIRHLPGERTGNTLTLGQEIRKIGARKSKFPAVVAPASGCPAVRGLESANMRVHKQTQ
jgi:hypothetical protein